MSTRDKPDQIDWEALQGRIDRATATSRMTDQRQTALLEERARRIAIPAENRTTVLVEVLSFGLGPERYAFETRFVREAVQLNALTPLPQAPAHLLGVTNLRGTILAVIDLRRLFDLGGRGLSQLSRVIVLCDSEAQPQFGVLADDLDVVRRIDVDLLRDPPSDRDESRALLKGVTADSLILLDGRALLEDPRMFMGADGAHS